MGLHRIRLTVKRALAVAAAGAAVSAGIAAPASAMSPAQTTESGVVNLLGNYSTGSVASFWSTTMQSWGQQYSKPTLYFYDTSTVGFPSTPCGQAQANNSFYCSKDNAIYLDYGWNQRLINQYGDFGGGGILAHEWGHAIDAWLGYRYIGYRSEYHADCLAGMYVHYGYATGLLTGGDYGEFYNWLVSQPSSPDHGTGAERAAWYKYGYTSYSLAACNKVLSGHRLAGSVVR